MKGTTMTTSPTNPVHHVQRELAAWHSTHPDATFAEIEAAVEAQLDQLRVQLLEERTKPRAGEAHPVCPRCGTTMEPRSTTTRTLLLRGNQSLELTRSYVTCPHCGAGLFPPG
jgi:YgiT-type zinc finger domain-containing protein